MEKILALALGYLVGNIQTAYLITKLVARRDIRKEGSGNAGATNVLRTLGPKYGVAVLILDVLKGILASTLAIYILNPSSGMLLFDISVEESARYILPAYAGLGAVLGHNYPFTLQFKGGKGAATTLGFAIFIHWIMGLSIFLGGIILIKITKYVSLSSMVALTLMTVIYWLMGYDLEVVFISGVLSTLIIYQHRENIVRLLNGTERKIGSSKK